MSTIEETIKEKVKELPPELRQEVVDFVEFLIRKHVRKKPKGKSQLKLNWKGALEDMKDQYTSVELQHKILKWWEESVFD